MMERSYVNCKDNRAVNEMDTKRNNYIEHWKRAASFIPGRNRQKYCRICGDEIRGDERGYCYSCRAFLIRKKVILKC